MPVTYATKPIMGERKSFKPFIVHQSCHDSNMIRAFFNIRFYILSTEKLLNDGYRVVALHTEVRTPLYVLKDIVRVLKGGEERQH